MGDVAIIGGGASGLMAAYSASEKNNVYIFEKNEKLGKKIYITGKGRCNLSNFVDVNIFLENVVKNPKFLYKALNTLSPTSTMELFENSGLSLKVERGNRVFPLSDKASDVTKTLEKLLIKRNVKINLNSVCQEILVENGKVIGIIVNGKTLNFDKVIIATGGMSYPLTGSTGDGYKFAKVSGHKIIPIKSALCGIELNDTIHKELQGLTLKNVKINAVINGKTLYSDFGELLFTHFGVSGPIILSCSSVINDKNLSGAYINLDLKPALSEEMLELRLLREFKEKNLKSIGYVMRSLVPKNMVAPFLRKAGVSKDVCCSSLSAKQRQDIIKNLKSFKLEIKRLRPIEEAIVTSGGVSVKDVDPKTMQSNLVDGLYFVGEVLDVDAFTGGFNLQIAFSTGYLAGINV